jgi:thioredoxin reductase
MLVRSGQLSDTMSRYLIQRIEQNPAIGLHFKTEIIDLEGDTHLERVTWRSNASGEASINEIRHVFIMAGASPRTNWLSGCLALDNKGFIPHRAGSGCCNGNPGLGAGPSSTNAGNKPTWSFCSWGCSIG